jgi:hypothetical protein
MNLDCLLAGAEFRGDLLVEVPVGDQRKDLAFAVGQRSVARLQVHHLAAPR